MKNADIILKNIISRLPAKNRKNAMAILETRYLAKKNAMETALIFARGKFPLILHDTINLDRENGLFFFENFLIFQKFFALFFFNFVLIYCQEQNTGKHERKRKLREFP